MLTKVDLRIFSCEEDSFEITKISPITGPELSVLTSAKTHIVTLWDRIGILHVVPKSILIDLERQVSAYEQLLAMGRTQDNIKSRITLSWATTCPLSVKNLKDGQSDD